LLGAIPILVAVERRGGVPPVADSSLAGDYPLRRTNSGRAVGAARLDLDVVIGIVGVGVLRITPPEPLSSW